jgi:hydroxymethylglutaryl-CoA synthase
MNDDTTSRNNLKNVGIVAMEVYFPPNYVKQSALEEYSGVAAGKYTIGLGQESIAIVNGDVEDINSICLTVVHNLLEK